MTAYLVKDATVLTLGARTQNHVRADVLVEGGIIAEVGGGLRARSADLIDAAGSIVMPGFVDAHRRCWLSLFKGDGEVPAASEIGPDDVYAGTLVALLGAAEAGITTVVDWYDGPSGSDHIDAVLRAHADSGVRSILVLAPDEEAPAVWRDTVAVHGAAVPPHTSLAAGVASGFGADSFARCMQTARDLGLRMHIVGRASDAGRFSGPDADLDGGMTVVQANGLDTRDLDAIASSGAGVVLTPVRDMTSGYGAPPMQALLDRGIRPGLGVGSEVEAPGDLLAQIRAAIAIQHATYFDLKLAGKGGLPNLLTTRDVIRYGTADGARAVGLGDATGSIEPGKQADLIVLRTDTPNLFPVNDPIGAVVWGVDTSNLDWVFVGGRPIMRKGVLQADVPATNVLARDARSRLGASTRRLSGTPNGGAR